MSYKKIVVHVGSILLLSLAAGTASGKVPAVSTGKAPTRMPVPIVKSDDTALLAANVDSTNTSRVRLGVFAGAEGRVSARHRGGPIRVGVFPSPVECAESDRLGHVPQFSFSGSADDAGVGHGTWKSYQKR